MTLDGKRNVDMAKEFKVTSSAVHRFKKRLTNRKEMQTTTLKGAVRLEITQENALSDLSKQMEQYTVNYERAIKDGDEKAALAWSARRVKLLERMLKVTGLYNNNAPQSAPITIW